MAVRSKTHSRRPELEAWLDTFAVEYEFVPNGAFADIDVARSLKNQARIKPLDEPTIERYEIAWRTGAAFPPIVTSRAARGGKQLVISGNHRLASGIKVGRTAMDRYEVIGAKAATVAAMCREANNVNGLPPNEDERILNAIFAMNAQGLTLKAAAELYQVPAAKVQRRYHETSSLRRAQEQSVDMHGFMCLSAGVRSRLGTLDPDEIFQAASNLAIKVGFRHEDIVALVPELNGVRSVKAKEGILRTWERNMAERIQDNLGGRRTSNARKTLTRRQRFGMAMGQVRAMGEDLTEVLDAYSTNELAEFASEVEEVVIQLQKLIDEARAR